MYGSYEIKYKDRTYFGDVTLKEYHIIERNGAYYLYRVQEMVALPIDQLLAQDLREFMPGSGSLIPDTLMHLLQDFGLVHDDERQIVDPDIQQKSSTFPVANMSLFITQTCNMRCIYCFGNEGEYGHRGIMSVETAKAAVDWLIKNSMDYKRLYISFFGGEPLLNFSLLQQVVIYAKEQAKVWKKEISFSISTNATLFTDKVINFLKEEKIEPLISFDGPPEIHNQQRPLKNGRNSYDIIVSNVSKLRAAFPNLTARATVCNGTDPFTVCKGIEEAGFAACQLSPVSPVISQGEACSNDTSTLNMPADKMLDYHRAEVARLFSQIRDRSLDMARPSAELALLDLLVDGRRRHVACAIGREMCAVSINGDIYPCHRYVGIEDSKLGNIRDYDAVKINNYHRAVVDNLPLCSTCWARYFCGGGCFYYNQACTGDMHIPDPHSCYLMKVICEDLIHGWCMLNEADRVWLREEVVKIDTEFRL